MFSIICHLVIPSKEWKPKLTCLAASQATEDATVHDNVPLAAADTITQSAPVPNSAGTEDSLKVDICLNDLQLSDKQHVIIPDHLQVSESEKYVLSFGSFDVSFQQTKGSSDPDYVKSSLPKFSSSHELDGNIDELQSMQRLVLTPFILIFGGYPCDALLCCYCVFFWQHQLQILSCFF